MKAGHYHVGCTRLFELTHKGLGVKKGDGLGNGESIAHPNRYFERSWNLSREAGGEENVQIGKKEVGESGNSVNKMKGVVDDGLVSEDEDVEMENPVVTEPSA